MLTEKYVDNLDSILLSKSEYKPFPAAADREAWDALPQELKESLIARGGNYLGFQWPALPATLHMETRRNGNRSRYEAPYFKRREALALLTLAECIEGRGKYVDDIINGVWCICEESCWCLPAHIDMLPDVSRPEIDLFSAETAALLSWVDYLLKPALDTQCPAVSLRILYEVRRRVMEPYLARNDFWWMSFFTEPGQYPVCNNWNPWCNSGCLTAFLLLEEDADTRVAAVSKCLASLDKFLESYHDDGGCDEGTSYWTVAGGMLFDCLELLHGAAGGKIDVYNEELVKNIGRFIYRAHISGDFFINFADGGARVELPSELVWRYGNRIGDTALANLGLSFFEHNAVLSFIPNGSLFRPLSSIMNYKHMKGIQASPPYVRDVWLDGTQVMAARDCGGSCKGLYLAAKGGHNDESHNHNDVGSFVVYSDGKPVLIDVGVETYTAKTFSDDRYSIWTMQSAYHNLPTVNGCQQRDGRQYGARDVSYENKQSEVLFGMNIADAYPDEAGIEQWKRSFRFSREVKAFIEIADDYVLREATKDIKFSCMTCCEPVIHPTGEILLTGLDGKRVRLSFDSEAYSATSERIGISDERLRRVWGERVDRIVFSLKAPAKRGSWKIGIYSM